MTTVLHMADTHIGYKQYHSTERRADFLAAFETVIEDAIEADVDAVVHAGDLFQDRHPDLQDLQGVVRCLRDLRSASIPFLAVVGNHEAKRGGQWLDLLAELDLAERLGAEPRPIGDLALYGLDFHPPAERERLDYDFGSHDCAHAALVAHGLFEPFSIGDWDAEEVLTASPVDFDAMLLGDNHDPGRKEVNDTWLTYPGSTERASASEREPRGYNLVRTNGDLSITRRTIPTREFNFVDVELEPDEGARRVTERLREYDHEGAVTIVTIEGDGESITPGPIEEQALEAGALVARVNDRRTVETEEESLSVSFQDPDGAIREQLREMELSTAARTIDNTVRDETVADSTVRETVKEQITDHLSTGLEDFEPATGGTNDGTPEGVGGDSDVDPGSADSDRDLSTDGAIAECTAESDDPTPSETEATIGGTGSEHAPAGGGLDSPTEAEAITEVDETETDLGVNETESETWVNETDATTEVDETESVTGENETDATTEVDETESVTGENETDATTEVNETESVTGENETGTEPKANDTDATTEADDADAGDDTVDPSTGQASMEEYL